MRSLPADYFEQMFAGNPDPWNFETSPYEHVKFETSIAALDGRRYRSALEVGCANGVFTQRLAPHCKAIVAIDVSETALARARTRNAETGHVTFAKMEFPRETPQDSFDLIVLSEVVYYWNDADIAVAGAWITEHLEDGGDLLLVHWIGETNYPQSGDGAVRLLWAALPDAEILHAARYEQYRLDLWRMV